ncbi:hypothetical protein L596_009785 [Steinernema carpocapsae]|uniref:Uncharacterized protein n=1 Tax=Steinernema carpocapsae TaxID=34508 RepID=A0A4V6A6Q2_STECR|nr:hypothetical protein L596_009785 [Steinernema carpocapsae]
MDQPFKARLESSGKLCAFFCVHFFGKICLKTTFRFYVALFTLAGSIYFAVQSTTNSQFDNQFDFATVGLVFNLLLCLFHLVLLLAFQKFEKSDRFFRNLILIYIPLEVVFALLCAVAVATDHQGNALYITFSSFFGVVAFFAVTVYMTFLIAMRQLTLKIRKSQSTQTDEEEVQLESAQTEISCQTEPEEPQIIEVVIEEEQLVQVEEELSEIELEEQVEEVIEEVSEDSTQPFADEPMFLPFSPLPALPLYSEPPPAYVLPYEKANVEE